LDEGQLQLKYYKHWVYYKNISLIFW
jgi:hypothetical protein